MEKVATQTLADATQPAVGTVVDGLVGVVVPQLANAAVVVGRRLPALGARVRRLLRAPAQHAKHVLSLLPREGVVLDGVVAVAARVPPLA
jgi:hypothetical protein